MWCYTPPMAIEIFWGSGSVPAWRVLLTLAVKKVPYTSHLLSFSKGEHKSPAMLAMNPRGKVPVLKNGDFVLSESLAIMTYLDRIHPEPPLFGTAPEEAAQIYRAIMEHECYGLPAISAFSRPLIFGHLEAQRDQVILAIDGAATELRALEERLAGREHLVTSALSAADLFVYPQIRTLQRAFDKPGAAELDHGLGPLATTYPALAAWCARIEALPGYDATFPPHWRT